MDPPSNPKKRERSQNGAEDDSTTHGEPFNKKSKTAEPSGSATNIKKSAAISSDDFRSPLRDIEPTTVSLHKARDILAYVQIGDPRSFKLAIKESFSFLTQSVRNNEYIQTYLALIYVAKVAAHYFHLPESSEQEANAETWHFLVGQLSVADLDLKRASEISVLACNILYQVFREKTEWPIEFVQALLEDSFGKRLWIDDESTRAFVCGVLSVTPKDRATEAYLAEDDTKTGPSTFSEFSPSFLTNATTRPGFVDRYLDTNVRERVFAYITPLIEFHLGTLNSQQLLFPAPNAPASDGLKNLIRTLSFLMPYANIRPVVARYLDTWFTNPQAARYAKELFRRMIINTADISQTDVDVVRLVLRYKSVPSSHPQLYFEMLSTVASSQPIYRTKLLRDVVSDLLIAEISSQTIGAKLLGRLFESTLGSNNESSLAAVIHELALDAQFGPQLKVIIPMILSYHPQSNSTLMRTINFASLCASLCSPYYELSAMITQVEPSLVSQWCQHIADSLMSILIHAVPKILYEQTHGGMISSIAAEREEAGRAFSQMSSQIQICAVDWCRNVLPSYLGQSSHALILPLLRKVLLLEPLSSAYYLGNKPLSAEQLNSLATTLYSTPIAEHTIMSLLLCGDASVKCLSEDDIIDTLEQILIRALRTPSGSELIPELTNQALVDQLFGLVTVHPPSSQNMELSSNSPETSGLASYRWAVRQRAWKACTLLVLCASTKPTTTGALIWNRVPMVKLFINMILTRSWSMSFISDPEVLKLMEVHDRTERQWLPKLEEAMSSEVTSQPPHHHQPKYMLFDPFATVCDPPSSVMTGIRDVEIEFKLSRQLFKSRNPDFVSDLLKKDQLKSARWISPLVSDPVLSSLLPNRCLCILLIASQAVSPSSHIPYLPPRHLVKTALKQLDSETSSSMAAAVTIWQFFFNNLSSDSPHIRISTHRALTKLMCDANDEVDELNDSTISPFEWLKHIRRITFYKAIADLIDEALISALRIETNRDIIAIGLTFLKQVRQGSSGSYSASDALSLAELVSEFLITSFVQAECITTNEELVLIAAELYICVLSGPSTASQSSHPLARWRASPNSPSYDIPSIILMGCAALLSKQSVLFDARNFAASMLHQLASMIGKDATCTVEYPIGQDQLSFISYLQKQSPLLASELSTSSLLSHYFSTTHTSNPIDQVPMEPFDHSHILSLCGFDLPGVDVASELRPSISVPMELDSTVSLQTLTLELFSTTVNDDSTIARQLGKARLLCNSSTPMVEISNLNQAFIRQASTKRCPPDIINELVQWRQTLSSIRDSAKSTALTAVREEMVQRITQEISILQPFVTNLPGLVLQVPTTTLEQQISAQKKDIHSLLITLPSELTEIDVSAACTQLITLIQSQNVSSTNAIRQTVSWIVQIASLSDFSAVVRFTFSKGSHPSDPRLKELRKMFTEVLHSEISWETKRHAIELLLGPSAAAHGSNATNSTGTPLSPLFNSEAMLPIEELDVSLGLKFLTLYLEVGHGKSWSDHLSSISNKVTTPLKDRPASLIDLSKPQLLRLVDLIMHELTHPWSDSAAGPVIPSPTMAFQSAGLLLACCNTADQQRDEAKVLWLIEYIAQTPSAHSMNIMRWVDDMTQTSLSLANTTSLTFRPEQLVHRFTDAHTESKHIANGNTHHSWSSESHASTDSKGVKGAMTVGEACESILTYIYFESPWQVFSVVKHFTNRVSATNGHSKLDYMIHRLLKQLLQNGPHDSTLTILRTLCLSHPAFIIKFLPTMSALLNGRTQAGPEEFLLQNSHEIFSNVLSIVEMLIPLIFHDKMAKSYLVDLLDDYFNLLQSMCESSMTKRSGRAISLTSDSSASNPAAKWLQDPRVSPLVGQLASFLASYCSEQLVLSEACTYLTPHLDTLLQVSECLPTLNVLKYVITSVQTKSKLRELEPPLSSANIQSIRHILSQNQNLAALWETKNFEETLTLVQDTLHSIENTVFGTAINRTSIAALDRHHASVLHYFIGFILSFMTWSTQSITRHSGSFAQYASSKAPTITPFILHAIERIRRSSLGMAVAFLQTFPREGEKVIAAFLDCLTTSRLDIRNDALPYAKSVCFCSAQSAQQVDLMMALFTMGKIGHNSLRDILSVMADLV